MHGKKNDDGPTGYRQPRPKTDYEMNVKDFAIASSINGIAFVDLDGKVTYVNKAAIEMWGDGDSSNILGKNVTVFAQSGSEALAIMQTVIDQGEWSGEITGRNKTGKPVTVLLSASLVSDGNGEPVCIMCSFVDISERKRMEEELRLKDSAIASSIVGIGISDLEGNITYVNDAALRMWGTEEPDEVLGMNSLGLAQSQDKAILIFSEIMENGSWSGEVSGLKKDGSPITVHLSANLVRDERGEPVCMMDSFVDITTRKRMEEELRIKDFAIASSINGIAIGDLEGNITYVNDAFLRLWGGNDLSEVVGKSSVTFAHSEDEAARVLNEIIEKGNWIGEITGKTKDGKTITVQLSASMVTDENDRPICLMCSFVDISERKVMEENLRIKESAISSSIVGIGIGNLDGTISYVNDAALNMWGAEDANEVLGMSALNLAQSEEEAIGIYRSVLDNGSWSGEVSGYKKDGTPITVHLSINMVKDEKGEPICMMDSFVDITERKRMEMELRVKDSAIASSINGIAIGDLQGRITYANSAFLDLWGENDISKVIGLSIIPFTPSPEETRNILNRLYDQDNWIGEITGRKKNIRPIALQVSASMVKNEKGQPICLMCSFVDITENKITEQKLQKAYASMEMRVEERTAELVRANLRLKREIEERKLAEQALLHKEDELRQKSLNLEEANTALKVLLKRGEQDKNELEEKVLSNIKELAMPYIEKLKTSNLDDKQSTFLEILESNLNDIVSPFLKKLSSQYLNLTPSEIQVANLIREGKSTKNMAELLNISERAIEFHRNNIRDKLGLKKKKTNLRSYLLSLS